MGLSIYYLHQAGERGKIEELAPGSFVREAESADIIPSPGMFQVVDDENASGGQFLWPPEGIAILDKDNVAIYNVNIPEAGTYKIIARAFATDGESDSFYVKFDDSKRYYTWDTVIMSGWNWEVLGVRPLDHASYGGHLHLRSPLSAGEHQFKLRARENGTRLDVLVFYREETMTQQLQAVENNPDAPYAMAKIYEAYGMYDEAIATYERAAELNPDSSVILERLAKLYVELDWAYLPNGQPGKVMTLVESVPNPDVRKELMLLLASHYPQSQQMRETILEWLSDMAKTAIDPESKSLYMGVLIYYLHQVGENEKIAQLAPGSFVREAESADTITGALQIESDENASDGQFVWTPEGSGNYESTSENAGDAIYNINIPEAGTYKIIARLFAGANSNSFFIKFDDSAYYYQWVMLQMSTWNWKVLTAWEQQIPFSLSAGEHQFKLRPREDGTRLDVLVFYRM